MSESTSGDAVATTDASSSTPSLSSEGVEKALIEGDLSELTPEERLHYYHHVCESLNLNPATKPFEYIKLNGQLTLYANKTAANQLRMNRKVSITKLEKEYDPQRSIYTVRAYAQDGEGRTDVDEGVVGIHDEVFGDTLANARMKAITKAKRRVTLSICGLGFLDETELQSIPNHAKESVHVDHDTGQLPEDLDYTTRIDNLEAWLYEQDDVEGAAQVAQERVSSWPDTPRAEAEAVIEAYVESHNTNDE